MTAVAVGDATYELAVVGEGPAVVFLHGFTGSAVDWERFAAALAPAHATVAVDLLGHGATSRPTVPARYALDRQAADLAEVLGRLAPGPATLVGYSYGARIALQLAADHPARVRGLALVSPSAGIADDEDRAARRAADEALAAELERDGIDAFVQRWEALPMFAGERRLPDAIRADTSRRRRANDPAALAAALRGAGQGAMAPLHGRLATIAIPTAILAGANDQAGVARARVVAAGIPGATVEILEDVGHAPQREVPDRFAAWLSASIERLRPPSPVLVPASPQRSAP